MGTLARPELLLHPIQGGTGKSALPPIPMSRIAIIGAGPAGLAAADQLVKQDRKVIVLEADPELVGGIWRTGYDKGSVVNS